MCMCAYTCVCVCQHIYICVGVWKWQMALDLPELEYQTDTDVGTWTPILCKSSTCYPQLGISLVLLIVICIPKLNQSKGIHYNHWNIKLSFHYKTIIISQTYSFIFKIGSWLFWSMHRRISQVASHYHYFFALSLILNTLICSVWQGCQELYLCPTYFDM